MNVELLKELTEAFGVPGQEGAIREIVRRELGSITTISEDSMGNLICHKPSASGTGPRVMIAAHMDEIGFVVRHISDKGFIRIHPLGGFDPRMLPAQRVAVSASSGEMLLGTLMPGTKPKHMLTAAEAAKPLDLNDFFVDLGLSPEDVKTKVKVGDMVALKREFQQTGNHYTCKCMDDRVAVFVMIEALKALGAHECEIYAVATTQEEIGLRGATAAGSGMAPDVCIAIDITLANDIPGVPEDMAVTHLGKGTAIKILDGSLICHPGIVAHFRRLAEEKEIPHQMELLPMGGTDAGGVQRQHGGVPSFTLSIPTRYVHTVNETVHPGDVQASIDIMKAYLEDVHKADYAKKR